MTNESITLVPIDAGNWRDVVQLEVTEEQRAFVVPTAHYLTMCAYDDVWSPLAVHDGERIVGMLMWAIDPDDGSCWIGGFLIDQRRQRQGIGRRAVELALERLEPTDPAAGFALSYKPANTHARDLYAKLGFVETGEMAEDEVVARLRPPPPPSRRAP